MSVPTLGIQLYTLRDHIKTPEDFDKTLSRLSALGVKDVQISAIGDFPASVQRAILDKYGMAVCVTHKGLDQYEENLDAVIADHKTLGCDAPGVGWAPAEKRDTYAHAAALAAQMNAIGKKLNEHGMAFHYHNHDFEFHPFPDRPDTCFYEVLLEQTDPEAVKFIPDVMWMHFAGQDPEAWVRRLAGRVKVLHFKDYVLTGDEQNPRRFCSLGKGLVDLPALYRAAKETGVPYIVYEQDGDWTDNDPFKATEESWAYMRGLRE